MSLGNSLLDFLIVIMTLGFIGLYSFRVPWLTNTGPAGQIGRSIMFLTISVMLVPMPKVLTLLLHMEAHTPFYYWCEVICKVPVVVALAWCIITFEITRKEVRDVAARRLRLRLDQAPGEGTDEPGEGPVEPAEHLPF